MPAPPSTSGDDAGDVSRKVEEGESCGKSERASVAPSLCAARRPRPTSSPLCLSPSPSALIFQLKQRAYAACTAVASAYADCCRGRTLSMAWACRDELKALSACLGQQLSRCWCLVSFCG